MACSEVWRKLCNGMNTAAWKLAQRYSVLNLLCFKILSLQLLAAFISKAFWAHCAEQLYFLSLIDILENIDLTVQWNYILLNKCSSHNIRHTQSQFQRTALFFFLQKPRIYLKIKLIQWFGMIFVFILFFLFCELFPLLSVYLQNHPSIPLWSICFLSMSADLLLSVR